MYNKFKSFFVKKDPTIYPVILSIATNNPPYKILQEDSLKIAIENSDEATHYMLTQLYKNTQIESRYMCINTFTYSADLLENRMYKYKQFASELVKDSCINAIQKAYLTTNDIHKLIVVSSTGLYAPYIDYEIIVSLNLPVTVERTMICFMGCAAGINGISIATDYVKANPNKNAMVVCIELPSLHHNFNDNSNVNDNITHAIFADGVSCCILTGKKYKQLTTDSNSIVIIDKMSNIIPNTEDGIQLNINSKNITCKLSKELPNYIEKNINLAIESFLQKNKLTKKNMDYWAVHPGGIKIINACKKGLNLEEKDVQISLEVLNNYGNMLSCSILFVLEKMLFNNNANTRNNSNTKHGLVFSFSPGVGIECILFRKLM